jgi:hypothetical protein
MRKQIITSLLPALAFGCVMGLGTHKVDDEGRYGTQSQIQSNIRQSIAQAEEKMVNDSVALGCSVDPSEGWGGFSVRNVVNFKRITDPKYIGSRHGVDNMDGLTVYRVSWDEGFALSKQGLVAVIAGCSK